MRLNTPAEGMLASPSRLPAKRDDNGDIKFHSDCRRHQPDIETRVAH